MPVAAGMKARTAPAAPGFALLEAIVALAILAAALIPLYVMLGGATQSALRLDRSHRLAEIELNALNVMSAVNPMEQPQGTIDLGPYAVRWTSEPLLDAVDGSAYPSGRSSFQLALYQARIEAVEPSGLVLLDFSLRMIGFRHVDDTVAPRR